MGRESALKICAEVWSMEKNTESRPDRMLVLAFSLKLLT